MDPRLLSVKSKVSASQSNVKAFKLTFPASFVSSQNESIFVECVCGPVNASALIPS